MEATINEKAMKAIGSYLERRGFEILENGWAHGTDSVDFIAREGDDLVFVITKVIEDGGDGFPSEEFDRAALERVAAAYLAQADGDADCAVRFDFVSMIVVGDSRAFLRHHRNCLSAA
ncbi:MAG: YraN family protein [Planifilum sp.]|jgi:putative endonuclease